MFLRSGRLHVALSDFAKGLTANCSTEKTAMLMAASDPAWSSGFHTEGIVVHPFLL